MVEQRTHKPLVAGSTPAPGTRCDMAWVYILRGSNGRYYLGSTTDLDRRLEEHRSGRTYSTRRLGGEIQLVGARACASLEEARALERLLKSWKNHRKVLAYFSPPSGFA